MRSKTSFVHLQQISGATNRTMMISEVHHVTYPVVVVKVNGVKCHIPCGGGEGQWSRYTLLDTVAGSSYASAILINRHGVSAIRVEQRKIEMMMHTTLRKIQVYNLKISSCGRTSKYALTSVRWKRTFSCH